MSLHPTDHLNVLRIGSVEFVSPGEIKVRLDPEAPDSVALNTGVPRPFPRVNGYVLVPSEDGFIVGQVEWLSLFRAGKARKGTGDKTFVDLPYPQRTMSLAPLGVLKKTETDDLLFHRGVDAFPAIGDAALLPTEAQLRSIVESGPSRPVRIGISPLAGNAVVKVDPDRLFGRHLAVLGNTGSGKSCSVAGLIQWSLRSAEKQRTDQSNPNARFLVLDPNGEYERAFRNLQTGTGVRVFKVRDSEHPLEVPLWFWNSAEWCSFTQASARAQAPLLRQSLRAMRNDVQTAEPPLEAAARRFLGNILVSARHAKSRGAPFDNFPAPKNFLEMVKKWEESVEAYSTTIEKEELHRLYLALHEYTEKRSGKYPTYQATVEEVDSLISAMDDAYKSLGGQEHELLPRGEDTPVPFEGAALLDFLASLAQESGAEAYVEFLLTRIRTMLTDSRMNAVSGDMPDVSLANWLGDYIGQNQAENGCVAVLDLSLVPADITHVITAVVARMTLEALQRYRKQTGKSLPTVLVMEEAHTFVARYREHDDNPDTAALCCKVFERIAREGRKFGLGLVLSSQRPSELSATVLSQCNTFLLHRISNDRDQEQIARLLPDSLRGLLRDLPTLPSQHAVLLGWASELPVLVRMDDLPIDQRPQSDDPDFWNVWRGRDEEQQEVTRPVDWERIAAEWQERDEESQDEADS